jgi:hypothetical protein
MYSVLVLLSLKTFRFQGLSPKLQLSIDSRKSIGPLESKVFGIARLRMFWLNSDPKYCESWAMCYGPCSTMSSFSRIMARSLVIVHCSIRRLGSPVTWKRRSRAYWHFRLLIACLKWSLLSGQACRCLGHAGRPQALTTLPIYHNNIVCRENAQTTLPHLLT